MTNPEVEGLVELIALRAKATPGRWEWFNGCSWWRLGTVESSGCTTVICPTVDRSDGHPNLIVSAEDREYIAALHNWFDANIDRLTHPLPDGEGGELEKVVAWLRTRPKHYSGWNNHDEQYDDGYNRAMADVANAIERGDHLATSEPRS